MSPINTGKKEFVSEWERTISGCVEKASSDDVAYRSPPKLALPPVPGFMILIISSTVASTAAYFDFHSETGHILRWVTWLLGSFHILIPAE